ncbi:MAG TPA: HAD-IA family hydrolase [Anaerolineae bacterium]|nr:HAD-IA family hydrolase [Anaerolineae bacterium]
MTTPRASGAPRAPRAIIFDLDGTLVDTVGTRVHSWMAVFPRFGIQPEPAFLAPLMGSDGKLLARMVAEHYGVELRPGDDAQIDIEAGLEFRVLNAQPRALPAARDILESLTDQGLPWAVATSSLPDDARESVQSLGLRAMPLICDGADVEHAKPAPDLLLKAAGLLHVEPEAAWYVGDSRWDMLASRAAGMRAIAVLTGATAEAELRETGADAVYPTLREFMVDILAS